MPIESCLVHSEALADGVDRMGRMVIMGLLKAPPVLIMNIASLCKIAQLWKDIRSFCLPASLCPMHIHYVRILSFWNS